MPKHRDDEGREPSRAEILAEIQQKRARERAKGRRLQKPKPIPEFLRQTIWGKHAWSVLLDVLSNTQHRDHDAVAEIVDVLIDKGTGVEAIREAVTRFNRWAHDKPPPAELDVTVIVDDQVEVFPDEEKTHPVAQALREFLMSAPSRPRVKRCPECLGYFFDTTKRNNARYNTRQCAKRAGMRRLRSARRKNPVDGKTV